MIDLLHTTITQLKQCIENKSFFDLEKLKIEIKDLSTKGEWNSLKETVCAFLNTEGGYVICGIRERDKQYTLTGFDRNNEGNLIELQSKVFRNDNDQLTDLSSNINLDYYDLLNKTIAVVYVKALGDDLKYINLNGKYFERKLTQDKEIPLSKLLRHKEYKQDLEYAKELALVDNANLKDLNLDKMNKYINLLNSEIKIETLKPSILKAKPFLTNQHFIKDDQITNLGLLVCGTDPFHFLENRSEVDCWYDTSSDIGKDKKIFRNDVISLMEDSFKYVWGNIKIARTFEDGGSRLPEYPEKLIRETINNAIAHRDYTINNFISITIEPGKYIEIKNPGTFKEKMKITETSGSTPIRRLIAGIPESKNPKLASVLKVFDKIESQGRGMASLVNFTMENIIDIPYYEIKDDSHIILRIPAGKLIDNSIENWLGGFENFINKKLKSNLDNEQKNILAYFYKSEILNSKRYYTILLHESNNHFQQILSLKNAGLIYEHESGTDNNPVYLVARELMKKEYTDELIKIFGEDYITFSTTVKNILNTIFKHTIFNEKPIKPSDITSSIYEKEYGIGHNPKHYESLSRKTRSYCQKLFEQGYLIKNANNAYSIKL